MNEKLYIPPAPQVIRDNTIKWGNPLGLTTKDCSAWAHDLHLPEKGPTILYTGCEYQMTSRIGSLLDIVRRVKFEDNAISALKGIQSLSHGLGINLTKIYGRISGTNESVYSNILIKTALTLKSLNIEFAYLKDEMYSGALLYDYGFFDDFTKQAQAVVKQFRESGVKRVIALTPHSAEIFEKIYPQFVPDFNFEVVPLIKVVAEALKKSQKKLSLPEKMNVTYQDPCHLARALKITEEPREILKSIQNVELRESASNKEKTMCCGAPCEIIYAELSDRIANKRIAELAATNADVVATLCPFCYSVLTKGARSTQQRLVVLDLMEIIYQALGEKDNGA